VSSLPVFGFICSTHLSCIDETVFIFTATTLVALSVATSEAAATLRDSPLVVGTRVPCFALGGYRYTVVMEVFSTIVSPVLSELVVIFTGCASCLPWDESFFRILRTMNEVGSFNSVFLLEPAGGP